MPAIRAANLDHHRDVVRLEIVTAFGRCLEDQPFTSLTIGGVATRAGVARNSVYRYYPDKTELLIAYLEYLCRLTLVAIDRPANPAAGLEDRLCAAVRAALSISLSTSARAAYGAIATLDSSDRARAHSTVVPLGLGLAKVIDPSVTTAELPLRDTDDAAAMFAGLLAGAGTAVDVSVDVDRVARLIARGVLGAVFGPAVV